MLPGMWLPVPTPAMVERFSALVKEQLALELDEKAALRAATQLLQIHYLLIYANRDLRPQVNRVRRPPGAEPGGPDPGSDSGGGARRNGGERGAPGV